MSFYLCSLRGKNRYYGKLCEGPLASISEQKYFILRSANGPTMS